jgi:hypothetical protein
MARKKKVEPVDELIQIPETTLMEVLPVVVAHAAFDNAIKVLSVSNVKHHRDNSISMDVLFEHMSGTVVPFVAHPDDIEVHGRWLYEEALKGAFGEVAEYDRPLPTTQDLQEELDKLMPDVVLGIATEEEISLAKALRLQIKAMS